MSLMKLLRNEVEKLLEKSPLLLKIATSMESLAKEVHSLDVAIVSLSQIVQAHHVALQELYTRQGLVMKAIKSNSLDMQMPDANKSKPAKPN